MFAVATMLLAAHLETAHAQSWYNPNWPYRRAITVANPGSTTLTAYQVQVTLKVQEIVTVYKPAVAIQVAEALLTNTANHTLGSNFKPLGNITNIGDPSISDVNNDTIHLSVTVHGTWVYSFSTSQIDQWRRAIQGLTPSAAVTYLKAQKYVSDAHVELPFGADHLPTAANDITIKFI